MVTLGVDEVGRGCWAGPLVAGAAILDKPIPGLTDSKLCTKRQRERLAGEIYAQALAVGLGWVSPAEVDEFGLTAAVRLAMERALEQISVDYDELIIDGNLNFFPHNKKAKAVIKADLSVPAVSAASIVAKVARDAQMRELASTYPGYGFEQHVGYGTKAHLASLHSLGVSAIHRKSYAPIRALLELAT